MAQRKEVYSCSAFRVLESCKFIMDSNLVNLQAGMKLACNETGGGYYRTYTVGSVLASCVNGDMNPGETIESRLKRNRECGGDDQFIFANATVLSNMKRDQEVLTEIKIGDLVLMEGIVSEVKRAPNNNLKLVPVENYDWVHPMEQTG